MMSDVIIPDGFKIEFTPKRRAMLLVNANDPNDPPYAAVYTNHPDAVRELMDRFNRSTDPRIKRD